MRPTTASLNANARQLGDQDCDGGVPVDIDVGEQVDDRIRFERLLTDLSATFVNVPADLVDVQIEHALERLVEFLRIERSSFGQITQDNRAILVTHSFVAPGYPPLPPMILDEDLPWYAEQ